MTRSLFEGAPVRPAVVGARLFSFRLVWTETIHDTWTLATVSFGHRWAFKNRPPRDHFYPTRIPPPGEKRLSLLTYVLELLQKQAITEVPPTQRGRGFYSPLFLVKKKSGDFRPVLDLKKLNRSIKVESFRMESLQSILQAINLGDWMLSIDLQDAYLHIPIQVAFQKFLRFSVGQEHFQFRSLPFGISTAPRTFTKVLLPVIASLREKGLRVHHYLDDILLLSNSQESLVQHREILVSTLTSLGWIINWQKSNIQPTQRMVFLGAELDTWANTVELPREKLSLLIQKVKDVVPASYLPARAYLSLLGSLSATIPMVRWAQWNTRPLQASFLCQWDGWSMSQSIRISEEARLSLRWWIHPGNLSRCKQIVTLHQEVVTSDASLEGWGAHYLHYAAQGRWYFRTRDVVSNVLEMKAAFQALLAFSSLLRGKQVLIQMDNRVAVAYINRQGGTRSISMMREVGPVMQWAQLNLQDLKAAYIPGIQNELADSLSRTFVSNSEWCLSPQAFALICQTWGHPDIDLAATPENRKCQRFLSRNPFPSAEGTDCLQHTWNFRLGYIFPPTPLIAKFLLRLKHSAALVLAVIPFWPRRPWFTTLLQLSTADPIPLPVTTDLLTQGQLLHPNPERLHLAAWRLKGLGS